MSYPPQPISLSAGSAPASPPFEVLCGDALTWVKSIPQAHCVVTSPPYYAKRAYGADGDELGREASVEAYVNALAGVFQAIPLHPLGSVWVNLGDSRDKKAHGLLLIPQRFALAMIASGWHLIDSVIWAKAVLDEDGGVEGHCMVEPATSRLNGNGYEHLLRFVKCQPANRAWSDPCAVRIPREELDAAGRRRRVVKRYLPEELMTCRTSTEGRCCPNVWRVNMGQTRSKHFAVYPEQLVERPVAMTCPLSVCRECGHLRSRLVAMEPYDDGRGRSRRFGKYRADDKEASGRNDTGAAYVPRKPVTTGWSACDHKDWRPGIVLDPFCGSGTTGVVSLRLGRRFIGIDLYPSFADMTYRRCADVLSRLADEKLVPAEWEG